MGTCVTSKVSSRPIDDLICADVELDTEPEQELKGSTQRRKKSVVESVPPLVGVPKVAVPAPDADIEEDEEVDADR